MPRGSASANTSSKSSPYPGVGLEANELYHKCLRDENTEFFDQDMLMGFGICEDVTELSRVCNELLKNQLFKIHMWGEQLLYKVRSRERARKVACLNEKERMVYNEIESAGNKGVWSGRLKRLTNLHPTIINRCLKALQNSRYVKSVRSRKSSTAKVYMLYELRPSDKVTGGVWYSQGAPDMDFITKIGDLVETYVKLNSWQRVRVAQHKGRKITPPPSKPSATTASGKAAGKRTQAEAGFQEAGVQEAGEIANKKTKTEHLVKDEGESGTKVENAGKGEVEINEEEVMANGTTTAETSKRGDTTSKTAAKDAAKEDPDEMPAPPSPKSWKRRPAAQYEPDIHYRPLSAGSLKYPTASEILQWIANGKVIKDRVIDLADLQQLLDMLVLDGRLEKMGQREVKVNVGYQEIEDDDDSEEDGSESSVNEHSSEDETDDEDGRGPPQASSKKVKKAPKPTARAKPAKPKSKLKTNKPNTNTAVEPDEGDEDAQSSGDESSTSSIAAKIKREDEDEADEALNRLVAYEDTYRWIPSSASRGPPVVIAGSRPWKSFDLYHMEKNWKFVAQKKPSDSDSDSETEPPPLPSASPLSTAKTASSSTATAPTNAAADTDPEPANETPADAARRKAKQAARAAAHARAEAEKQARREKQADKQRRAKKVSWWHPPEWDWDWMERNTRPTTGLSEAPCARCVRFRECGPGGEVTAEACEYLTVWLSEGKGRDKSDVLG